MFKMLHMKRITARRKQVEKALKAMNIKYSLVKDVFIYNQYREIR